jgi:dihydropteroate synthase
VSGLRRGSGGTGESPLAATDAAADGRTAVEIDRVAANAQVHDLREEREAARVTDAPGDAAESPSGGSSD